MAKPCGIAELYAALPDGQAGKLRRAMTSGASHTAVRDAIRDADDVPDDVKPSRFQVSWHRRGECSCGQP